MTPRLAERHFRLGVAARFLELLGADDDPGVERWLEPDYTPRSAAAIREVFGLSTWQASILAEHLKEGLDSSRSAFTPDGLYIEAHGGRVRLAVRDHGDHYGVEPLPHIGLAFRARLRLPARRITVGGGSGTL